MSGATLVVIGDVVLRAGSALERAAAIGVRDGRVVSAGTRHEVFDAAAPGATVLDAGRAAVIPGLHDSHIHLVGLARSRRELLLDDARDATALLHLVADAARRLAPEAWLRGRGWHAEPMRLALRRLGAVVGDRPALLTAHDGHSAWASAAALRSAGITAATDDPVGGRLERDAHGAPTGILRETAIQLVAGAVPGYSLDETRDALRETIATLHARGMTGVTDAGDAGTAGGTGAHAALGDTFSTLAALSSELDGRLRITSNVPHAAIASAAAMGLRTGASLGDAQTLRCGWAKLYSDGALGSRTAAVFTPYLGEGAGSTGLLRLDRDTILAACGIAVPAGIGLAIHAIGDRAAATVLDAFDAMPPRRPHAPPHRLEHAQLLRASDRPRLARNDLTASMQPIHAVADRDLADAAWGDRLFDAYAWRSIAATSARLAFGSDAPVESPDPWLGIFAAVRRHAPWDPRGSWTESERVTFPAALAAYTTGAASAHGRDDEGHLHPGARADFAVLDAELDTMLVADERLLDVHADRTYIAGIEVHRA